MLIIIKILKVLLNILIILTNKILINNNNYTNLWIKKINIIDNTFFLLPISYNKFNCYIYINEYWGLGVIN